MSVGAAGLKPVHIPAELMVKFLNLAQANTNRGVETGGFIFGKLVTIFSFKFEMSIKLLKAWVFLTEFRRVQSHAFNLASTNWQARLFHGRKFRRRIV